MTQTINIIELAETHGQTSYRNRADTAHPAYGFTEEGLQAFAHALLAAEGKCLHQIAEPVQAQMPDPVGVAFTFETEEGGALASQVTSSPSKLPMGWCNLYTEQQVRGYVDADRTQRAAAPHVVQAAVPVAGQSRFKGEKEWQWCSPEHVAMVLATPSEWLGYEVRYLYAHPAEGVPAPFAVVEREAFEQAFIAEKLRLMDCGESDSAVHAIRMCHLKRYGDGEYPSLEACFAWFAWQARAALAATQPAAQGLDAQDASVLQYLLSNAKYHEWDGGYRADFDISINADVNGARAESAKEAVQNILAAQAKQGGV